MPCKPCTFEYSKGNGTGVAEALGGWGFSSEVSDPGNELSRMVCLFEKMAALKDPPKSCGRMPEPCKYLNKPKCQKPQMICCNSCTPRVYPAITYCGVHETHFRNNKRQVKIEQSMPSFGRQTCHQGNDKWYKLGPLCCPQPSCPAPVCPEYIVCTECPPPPCPEPCPTPCCF